MRSLEDKTVDSFTTAFACCVIAAFYVVTVHWWKKVSWKEAFARTGLNLGSARYWLSAVALLPVFFGYAWLSLRYMPVGAGDTTSAYRPFLGRGLTPGVIAAVLAYGFVSAGFGEELLFRGLIGGALGRRMNLRTANIVQAAIFFAPHLLALFVMPPQARPLLLGVFVMGLINGWLRLRSGSIGPGVLLHGAGNTLVGILVALSSP